MTVKVLKYITEMADEIWCGCCLFIILFTVIFWGFAIYGILSFTGLLDKLVLLLG